jgi:hypothetical protein
MALKRISCPNMIGVPMKINVYKTILLPLISFIISVSIAGQSQAQEVDFTSSNLPILMIDTHGEQIVDPYRIPADMKIIYNGEGKRNYLTDMTFNYNGKIGIELRGSSSLQWPKQPYRLETHDSSGVDLNVSLLGMPEENDWVLHNPFSDKTLIRNVLAYKISNDLGRYASRTRLCEVWLNEQYQGVYVLMEKIKRDNNRVDIARLDSSDVEGEDLTGGYIIKIDKTDGEQVGGWRSKLGTSYQYHYPKPSEILEVQKDYIINFMNTFEKVMNSPGYADPDTGYTKYFDMDAFVDFCIVNEISKNIDGYRLSTFMYKDRDSNGGLLTLGPVWDFNLSFGNSYYYDGERIENWNLETLINVTKNDFSSPFWMEIIWKDAEFKSKFAERWKGLRATKLHIDTLLTYIDALADTLNEAQERNFAVWPILGQYVWPNFFIGDTWEEEIEHLKEWTRGRVGWIDKNIGNSMRSMTDVDTEIGEVPSVFNLEQNYPNPFNPSTHIRYSLTENSHITLKVYNMLGQEIKTLADEFQSVGSHLTIWDGKDNLGNLTQSGVYTVQLKSHTKVLTRKMLLLR